MKRTVRYRCNGAGRRRKSLHGIYLYKIYKLRAESPVHLRRIARCAYRRDTRHATASGLPPARVIFIHSFTASGLPSTDTQEDTQRTEFTDYRIPYGSIHACQHDKVRSTRRPYPSVEHLARRCRPVHFTALYLAALRCHAQLAGLHTDWLDLEPTRQS
jgi:hypothetical protein